MPHEDPNRDYWLPDPHEYDEAARARFATFAKRAEEGSEADRSFFDNFVRRFNAIEIHEPTPPFFHPIHSFIDSAGDEVRAVLIERHGTWWDWCLKKYTQGTDGIWYPYRGYLERPLSDIVILRECMDRFGEFDPSTVKRPHLGIARVDSSPTSNAAMVLAVTPARRGVEFTFRRWHTDPDDLPRRLPGGFAFHCNDFDEMQTACHSLEDAALKKVIEAEKRGEIIVSYHPNDPPTLVRLDPPVPGF